MFTSFQEKSAQLSKGITVSNVFKVVCDYFHGQLIVTCLEISYILQSSSNALGSILVSYTMTQYTEPSSDWQRYFQYIQYIYIYIVYIVYIVYIYIYSIKSVHGVTATFSLPLMPDMIPQTLIIFPRAPGTLVLPI